MACWLNEMCKSGYCVGNNGGITNGICARKNSVALGGACHFGYDDLCIGSLSCALDQVEGSYVCCSSYGELYILLGLCKYVFAKYNGLILKPVGTTINRYIPDEGVLLWNG